MTFRFDQKWLARTFLACVMGVSFIVAPHSAVGASSDPTRVERDYSLKGTLSLSADRGFVLSRDDTGRAVIIASEANCKGDWPVNLARAMDKAQKDTGFLNAWVHGTFKVYPVRSDRPDRPDLRYACIRSADDLAMQPASTGK